MTKRLIDLDDELLARAQQELNATGVSDTVRAALRQATSAAARARQVAWLREGGLEAMAEPDERADAGAIYSARTPKEYEQVRADRREAYEYLPTEDGHWQAAFEGRHGTSATPADA